MAPPNSSAQIEAEASGDRRPQSLHDGARQLLGLAQALGMVRVCNLRRGWTALPHRKGHDPRRSDEGARRAFHLPEVRFVAGAVYGSPPGSAMQSTPTSCNSSLGSSSATAMRAGDPRERHADGVSLDIEGWRNRALALFAADSAARTRGKDTRGAGGGAMSGFTGRADTSGWVVDACASEAARLPAERSLFIGPRRRLATRGSRGRFAGHPRELGLVRDDFAR
jgi:hypothetical protein